MHVLGHSGEMGAEAKMQAGIARRAKIGDHASNMKAKLLLGMLAAAAALGLTSCPETSVPRDFGAKPLKLKGGDWSGTWRGAGGDDDFRLEIKDAAAGQITVFTTDKEKKTENTMEFFVRQIGAKGGEGLVFLTSFDKPGAARGSLSLATQPEKGVFHIWGLRHDVVESAVKSGELKGELKPVKEKGAEKPHNHCLLAADAANYAKLTDAKFWEWTKPGTFIRQGKGR